MFALTRVRLTGPANILETDINTKGCMTESISKEELKQMSSTQDMSITTAISGRLEGKVRGINCSFNPKS